MDIKLSDFIDLSRKEISFKNAVNSTDMNEAAFNESALEKVVKVYAKLIGKKIPGGDFKLIGLEEFKRDFGPGKGFRYINEEGAMLRFNWDAKVAKKATYDLTSLDFWEAGNVNFQKPTKTIVFKKEFNVIEVIGEIARELKTHSIKEAEEKTVLNFGKLFEAEIKRSAKEKQDWLVQHGLPKSLAGSVAAMKDRAKEMGLGDKIEIFFGKEETNSFEEELQKSEKMLSDKVFADPETVFEDIEDVLSIVASKEWRTLVVCGMGGIGKTFHITEGPRSLKSLLGPEGEKWTYHSGTKAAPFSFYKTLFQERDKIIVFDEADSILKNPDIIMMLKPILDTSGDNMAEYMSGTKNMVGMSKEDIEDYSTFVDSELADGKMLGNGRDQVQLPSKFKFTGGMVFISNMRANQIEQAIMSRSIFIDVYLAEQDVLKRIKSIGYAQAKAKGMDHEEIDMIMEALGAASNGTEVPVTYMSPEYARKSKQVTVRALQLAMTMKKAGLKRWDHLAAMYA